MDKFVIKRSRLQLQPETAPNVATEVACLSTTDLRVLILGCFIHLVNVLYTLHNLINTVSAPVLITSQALHLLEHLLRLILITEPCNRCLIENKRTINSVCRLLSEDIVAVQATDEGARRRTLELFILCLAQQKIELTACELIKIDRTLVTKVVGLAVTYLVVLAQFV